MSSVMSVSGLSMAFGKQKVLEDVNLDLAPDRVHVLLGSNGAGKSTLLRCMLGLLKPQAGSVDFLGVDVRKSKAPLRELITYVPDEADACDWMTATDLFYFLSKQYRRWSPEKVKELCERTQVPLKTSIKSMSRGEAAKTMLVAALAPQPKLLLLDEPFARLDPPTRELVLGVFLEEAPLDGGAVLLATHDLEVAARAADRVLLLEGGRITTQVDVEELQSDGDTGQRLTARLRELYTPAEVEQAR